MRKAVAGGQWEKMQSYQLSADSNQQEQNAETRRKTGEEAEEESAGSFDSPLADSQLAQDDFFFSMLLIARC